MPAVTPRAVETLGALGDEASDFFGDLGRRIATAASHSGDFLHAVPCSSVGTRLDDTSLRIAISLRLGAIICAPHTCVCG